MLQLHEEGYSNRKIAETMSCSDVAVGKCLKRIKERGCLLGLPRSGRKRVSTAADDRRLLRLYKANKKQSARDLQTEWHLAVCSQTIRNRLNEQGLKNYSTTKKPHLSSKNIQQRLDFCKNYEGWTVEDWNTVVFSDETNIQAEPNGGHRKVLRKQLKSFLSLQ